MQFRRTLSVFLQDSETATPGTRDLVARNKSLALGLLKSLSDKNVAHLNETCIMAWGQVGVYVLLPSFVALPHILLMLHRIVSDEGLSLVLVKLLDFLGHSNTMVSAFAFNEVSVPLACSLHDCATDRWRIVLDIEPCGCS